MNEFERLLIYFRDNGIEYVTTESYHSGTGATHREVDYDLFEAVLNRATGTLSVYYCGEIVGDGMTAEDAARLLEDRHEN